MRVIHNQGLPCPGEGFCCSLHFPHGDATGPNALELIWKPSDDDMAIFGSANPDDWPNEWAWRSDCADDHGSSSCPTDSDGNSVTTPELGNDAGLGGAANAESFQSLEGLVSALDAMSPDDSAGARLREEATIDIAGVSRNNQATFRKLFSMYVWSSRCYLFRRKTGAAEMTRLLRQKLEENLRRYLRRRSEITLAAGPTLSRMIQDDQVITILGSPKDLCSTALQHRSRKFSGLSSRKPFTIHCDFESWLSSENKVKLLVFLG